MRASITLIVAKPPLSTAELLQELIGSSLTDAVAGLPSYQPSIADSIAALNSGKTTSAAGVPITGQNSSGAVSQALALAKAADVVVLAIGIAKAQEHEGVKKLLLPILD